MRKCRHTVQGNVLIRLGVLELEYGSDFSPDSSIHQPLWQQNSWSQKNPIRESWNDEYGSFLEEPESFYDNICEYQELEVESSLK